jgi:hypothetical protein
MKGPVTLFSGNILLASAGAPSAFAQQPTEPLSEQPVGTWDLVSNYAVRQNGIRLDPFGINPSGLTSSIPRGCRTWPVSIALVSMLCFLSPTIAQVSQPELPPNTLRCEGFKKNSDGTWYAEKSAPFDIGDTKEVTVERQVIGPGSHKIAGIDLYVLLERKCAGSRG